jgi:NADH dehydrogenase [ubiquinone] 1 alpha subcomplex assembly factor 7
MVQNINNYIKNIININGPLGVDKFTQIASSYYYSNFDSIGQHSDFITAPEISQMFGEIIAIYLSEMWYQKVSTPFILVELGPGNGTMMSDILRTMQNFKEIYNNISEVALIETSSKLQRMQKNTLKNFDNLQINWYQDLDELEGKNFFIVANEFFDALPVKQYLLKEDKIYEVVISLNEENNFTFGLVDNISDIIGIDKFSSNQLIEVSEQRSNYVNKISSKISDNKGLAIIIDYGYINPPNKSTLQAVKKHKKIGLFNNVGESDITSLVDFAKLQENFKKNNIISSIMNQSAFLLRHGISERAKMLVKCGASREKIDYQVNKLISNKEMGDLFKVLITL